MNDLSAVPTLHASRRDSRPNAPRTDPERAARKQFVFRIELYATVEGAESEEEARISALGVFPRRIQVVELGHDVVVAADDNNVELLQEKTVGRSGSFFGDLDRPCG